MDGSPGEAETDHPSREVIGREWMKGAQETNKYSLALSRSLGGGSAFLGGWKEGGSLLIRYPVWANHDGGVWLRWWRCWGIDVMNGFSNSPQAVCLDTAWKRGVADLRSLFSSQGQKDLPVATPFSSPINLVTWETGGGCASRTRPLPV